MKRTIMILAMVVLMLALAATAIAAEPPGDSRVRVAHLSPDAPNVDVWVNGAYAFQNVAFEDITDYATLPAGDYLVQVEPAGAGGGGPFVISATLTLDPDTEYTVAALDELANITPGVFVDDNSLPAVGNAHIRFIHGSPDAPAVDITLTDGTVLIANTAFGEASSYLPVPAGVYDLEVRVAGTSTVVLSLPGIAVAERTVYTAYATGFAGGGLPALNAVISEDAGVSRVRVAHLSPDAPNVDVKVNGAVAVPDLAFEEITGYLELPSNAYLVEVVPAGMPGPVVISAVLDLDPNTDYTVAAVNDLANIEPLVLIDDNKTPAPGNAHIRFLHASPDAPAVDITLPDGTIIFGNVAFKEVGNYLPVPYGFYDVEVRLAGTTTVVLALDDLPFKDQHVYTVYATGFAGGATPPLNAILSLDARPETAPTDVSLTGLGSVSGGPATTNLILAALLGVIVLAAASTGAVTLARRGS